MASASAAISVGVRKRISSRSIFGSGTRRHGDRTMSPASTAASMALASNWYALWTVAGNRPDADRSATHWRTSSCSIDASERPANAGST